MIDVVCYVQVLLRKRSCFTMDNIHWFTDGLSNASWYKISLAVELTKLFVSKAKKEGNDEQTS